MVNNLLVTGRPGVGKTTLVKDILHRNGSLAVTGFYTEEIREEGARVGFRVVALNGSSAVFAHRSFLSGPGTRVGRYGVKVEALEALVPSHLEGERKGSALIVIDEIARMELLSSLIKEKIEEALDGPVPVLGTIAWKGTGFIKRVKRRPDTEIFELTLRNRGVLGEQINRRLSRVLETAGRG